MKLTNEHKLYIEFSIGCALQVLPIWEKRYPSRKEPQKALQAARAFLESPTNENKAAAAAYANAAYAAAADAAANAAANAAYAAAAAANAAAAAAAYANAAYAAAAAADAAAYAAANAAPQRLWQVKFLAYLNFKYGLSVKIRGVE